MSAPTSRSRRSRPGSAVAVIPVRDGALPLGGADVPVVGPGGLTVLMGTGCAEAAAALPAALTVWLWDAGPYAPGSWAEQLAPLLRSAGQIVLPASPTAAIWRPGWPSRWSARWSRARSRCATASQLTGSLGRRRRSRRSPSTRVRSDPACPNTAQVPLQPH